MKQTTKLTLLIVASLHALIISNANAQINRGSTANFSWYADVDAANYSAESHPGNEDLIRKQERRVSNIHNGTWLAFKGFDFGPSLSYFWIEAASSNQEGGTIELRVGGPTGT